MASSRYLPARPHRLGRPAPVGAGPLRQCRAGPVSDHGLSLGQHLERPRFHGPLHLGLGGADAPSHGHAVHFLRADPRHRPGRPQRPVAHHAGHLLLALGRLPQRAPRAFGHGAPGRRPGLDGGLMKLAGLPFTVVNVMGLPMILGIGIDDGVHLVHRWVAEGQGNLRRVFASTGKAVLLTSLTTMLGFGSLVFSIYRDSPP